MARTPRQWAVCAGSPWPPECREGRGSAPSACETRSCRVPCPVSRAGRAPCRRWRGLSRLRYGGAEEPAPRRRLLGRPPRPRRHLRSGPRRTPLRPREGPSALQVPALCSVLPPAGVHTGGHVSSPRKRFPPSSSEVRAVVSRPGRCAPRPPPVPPPCPCRWPRACPSCPRPLRLRSLDPSFPFLECHPPGPSCVASDSVSL